MGMPVIVPGTSTRYQAITDIVSSVALQEAALAHILNAEGEKIQKFVADDSTASYAQILEANTSVTAMVEAVANLEILLRTKLELFSDLFTDDTEE
ncbi:MAG: hypothetical protein R3Y53_00640 [Bacillota bacterium]